MNNEGSWKKKKNTEKKKILTEILDSTAPA